MKMQYAPEQYFVRFIGFLSTEANATLKVFSTVSKQHILVYPENPTKYRNTTVQALKVTKLSPTTRRRLGC
jgi:hypothetical protein